MADRLTVQDVHKRPIYDIVIEENFATVSARKC